MNRAFVFFIGTVILVTLAGCSDSSRAGPKMTTAEFEALVKGKQGREVIEAVGPPHKTQKGGGEFWYYDNIATDPITGQAVSAQLIWPADSTGWCETVNWH